MTIVECEIPSASVLDRRVIEAAYFRDSYRAPLSRTRASVVDIFFGIFGHHPIWMKIPLIVRNRIASFCGLQAAELAFAVPQVVAHRMTRMALAGTSPSARDRKEFHRMGTEKVAALTESWNAMAMQALLANQRMAFSYMQSLWFPWLGPKPTAKSASRQMTRAALGILGEGMAPIHRRAVANAKRLRRTRRK